MNNESKIIVGHVDTIKNKVDLLTGRSSDLETLDDIITECKAAKKKIKTARNAYYVCIVEAGDPYLPDINRYYIPIGFTSMAKAEKLAKKCCKNMDGFDYRIKEVSSREVYNMYVSLDNLNNVQYVLPKLCYCSRGRDYDLEEYIEKERSDLRDELGLRHEWEYVINESETRNG